VGLVRLTDDDVVDAGAGKVLGHLQELELAGDG
jgi:hypothetical protein